MRQSLKTLPASSLLTGQSPRNPFVDLVREVRGSLSIADQYATPDFIRSLLPSGPRTWSCKLLVSPKIATSHRTAWAELVKEFPGLEVRADKRIHDRFVIRDDEEAYAFGHSLKDLDKGRVSFFSRVYDNEQFEMIRSAVSESWEQGVPVVPL